MPSSIRASQVSKFNVLADVFEDFQNGVTHNQLLLFVSNSIRRFAPAPSGGNC